MRGKKPEDIKKNKSIVSVSSVAGELSQPFPFFNASLIYSSRAGLHGNVGQANYSTAKAGIVGLTKTIAKEWGTFGVRANSQSRFSAILCIVSILTRRLIYAISCRIRTRPHSSNTSEGDRRGNRGERTERVVSFRPRFKFMKAHYRFLRG